MAAVVVPFEIGRRGFAAQIAIDALIIDIEFARYVFGVFVRNIGHGFFPKMKWNVRKKRPACQVICVLTRFDATGRCWQHVKSLKRWNVEGESPLFSSSQ
jgi:hypothetical protein